MNNPTCAIFPKWTRVKRERHSERVYFAQIDVLKDGNRCGERVILPPDKERGFASDEQASYDPAL